MTKGSKSKISTPKWNLRFYCNKIQHPIKPEINRKWPNSVNQLTIFFHFFKSCVVKKSFLFLILSVVHFHSIWTFIFNSLKQFEKKIVQNLTLDASNFKDLGPLWSTSLAFDGRHEVILTVHFHLLSFTMRIAQKRWKHWVVQKSIKIQHNC